MRAISSAEMRPAGVNVRERRNLILVRLPGNARYRQSRRKPAAPGVGGPVEGLWFRRRASGLSIGVSPVAVQRHVK